MALARTYSPAAGGIQVTLAGAYADRLDHDSDIREYLPFLHETAAGYPQVRVLELGTRKGNSTLAFLAGAAETRGHVWSVDIDPCDQDPGGMGPWAGCPLWTFTRGDDLHPSVLAAQPPQVDVLFVDTSHLYDETLQEFRAYVPRVAPGGVVLCHDTNLLLREAAGAEYTKTPPVAGALNDYCGETGRTWENLPGEYGMGVIRVA
jgi:predicted O-methyltransferase YrrM